MKNATSLLVGDTFATSATITGLSNATYYWFNAIASNSTHTLAYGGGLAFTPRFNYVFTTDWTVTPFIVGLVCFACFAMCAVGACHKDDINSDAPTDSKESGKLTTYVVSCCLICCFVPFFFGGYYGLYLPDYQAITYDWSEGLCAMTSVSGPASDDANGGGRPWELVVTDPGDYTSDVSFQLDMATSDETDDGSGDDPIDVHAIEAIGVTKPGVWLVFGCFFDSDDNIRVGQRYNAGGDVVMLLFAGIGAGCAIGALICGLYYFFHFWHEEHFLDSVAHRPDEPAAFEDTAIPEFGDGDEMAVFDNKLPLAPEASETADGANLMRHASQTTL